MSTPDLMRRQARRWMENRRSKREGATTHLVPLEKELETLREQENRYAKAYGAGLFSIEKLQELVSPLKERIALL
jgi:site-specific DNA recombinase